MTGLFALAWWLTGLMVLLASTLLALAQPMIARRREREKAQPPVSILVPLKRDTPGLALATRSALQQDYPVFDVSFAAIETASPAVLTAVVAAEAAASTHPWRLVRGEAAQPGFNPKIANLLPAYETAPHDHVLLKDADTILAPRQLAEMMRALNSCTGLMVAVPLMRDPRSFAADIECAFVNTHGARLLLAADALGLGVGIGAAMLFRRSDLERCGGLAAISRRIADDHALAKALAGLGLATRFCATPVDQVIGMRRLADVMARQTRWARCRRTEAPLAYATELLPGLPLLCLAAALATPVLGIAAPLAMGGTIAMWVGTELLLAAVKGWPLSPRTPLAILAREAMAPVVWLRALAP